MVIPKRQRGGTITAEAMVESLREEGIGAEVVGVGGLAPTHVRTLGDADENCLSFYIGEDSRAVEGLRDCVLLCRGGLEGVHKSVCRIAVDDPRLAFTIIAQEFLPSLPEAGVHPTAIIDPKAEIHPSASIGP